MNASALETRITEAESDPTLVRQLIADFKAYKDEQLSDLTTRVNAAEKAQTEAESAQKQAEEKTATAEAALTSQKIASDTALEQFKTTAANELLKAKVEFDAEMQVAGEQFDEARKIAETRMESLTTVSKERDALAAQLAALKEGQTKIAQDAIGKVNGALRNLEAASEGIASISEEIREALRPANEKAEAARLALIAQKEAELATLKGG